MRNISPILLVTLFFVACQSDTKNTSNSNSEDTNNKLKTTLFSLIPTQESNVTFQNEIIERPDRTWYAFNPVYNGAGVAVGDVNQDGLPDIYFTGNEISNKLYLNKGDFKFEDVTEKAGVSGGEGWHNGVNMIDINGDGYLDIYVCRGGYESDSEKRRNLLYINTKDGRFSEMAARFKLDDPGYSFHSVFLDYDLDGDLDLYVINHPAKSWLGLDEYEKGHDNGTKLEKDRLYRNNGDMTFSDVTDQSGLSNTYGFGLSATVSDLDGNGYPDIYVTNDYVERDYMFMNQGDGRFEESVKSKTGHISLFAMGTDIADFNNDGLEDMFTTEMLPTDYKRSKTMMANMNVPFFEEFVSRGFHHQYMHNSLQLNRSRGHFSEMSQLAGLNKTGWSWACFLSDFDNDGLRDAFIANGYKRDVYDKDSEENRKKLMSNSNGNIYVDNLEEFLNETPSTKTSNSIFKNMDGYKFELKSKDWGLDKESFSNGAAKVDLDNDGDLDLVINNFDEPAFIYRNNAEQLGHNYLRFKLQGPKGNKHGIGAKISLVADDLELVEYFKMTRGYLSSTEPFAHFGLGNKQKVDKIEVVWPDGKINKLSNQSANQVLEINYEEAKAENVVQSDRPTLFSDVTNTIISTSIPHNENTHDDFGKQVLLPHRLSRLGPFVSKADVNGDGYEDMYVGGAKNQPGTLLLQSANGRLSPKEISSFEKDRYYEDHHSVFFDIDSDGDKDLYVVSGGTELPSPHPYYYDRCYMNDGKGNFTTGVGVNTLSSSCVKACDYDGDGDEDLFVGGRTIPEFYPQAPPSFILRNDGEQMTNVTPQIAPMINNVGMVTDATWTDINQDQKPDLVIVGEWMPIKIFISENGNFVDKTDQYINAETEGWWNSIEVADLDGDGDQDFVVGNLGHNYKFKASPEKPFHIYSSDFDENGSYDIFLAKYDGDNQVPVRGRQCASEQLPVIADKFESFNAFADADIQTLLGADIDNALHYEAKMFSSIILRNNGGQFAIEKLPLQAQLSTLNDIIVEDFDDDQILDILIAGNMYGSEPETSRADASVGLLLRGSSDGKYKAVSPQESGVFLPYDVKDLQVLNSASGAKIIAVTCNNDQLRFIKAD